MAEIAGPSIVSVVRFSGSAIRATYTAGASGYTRMYIFVRKSGTASWLQANSTTTLNGQIEAFSAGGVTLDANASYDVYLVAGHTSGGLTAPSSTSTVGPWPVATPSFVSITRVDDDEASVVFEGAPFGAGSPRLYLDKRALPGGEWGPHTSYAPTAAAGSFGTGGLGGLVEYEFRMRAGHYGVLSDYTGTRTLGVWWLVPPAPTGLSVTRTSASVMDGVFSLPATTGQTAPDGFRVFRTPDGQPFPESTYKTLIGAARSFQDTGSFDPTVAYRYGIEAFNAAGVSSRTEFVVPAGVLAPMAPSGVSATYLATDRAQLAWTRNVDADQPVDTYEIVRRRGDGSGPWVDLASLSGLYASTIVSLGPNRDFELGVRARNAAGTSDVVVGGRVRTTPGPVMGVAGAWSDATTIHVRWSTIEQTADTVDVEFSTDNTAWFPGASLPFADREWYHESATPTVPHWYRVRQRHTVSGLASAWVYSDEVAPQTAPFAPTMGHGTNLDAAAGILLTVAHNTADGTPQTAAQIRYRVLGSPTWTTQTLTTATSYTIPGGTFTNGQKLEVQGRTAGATTTYGAWSPSLVLTLEPRPTVTITTPATNADWPAQDMRVAWTASAQSVAEVSVFDLDTNAYLANVTVGPAVRELLVTGAVQGHYLRVEVVVRAGQQRSLPAQRHVTVALDLPAAPAILTEWYAAFGGMLLTALPDAETESIVYYRQDLEGEWVLLGVPTFSAWGFIDRLAPLGNATYKARAYKMNGGWADSEPVTVPTVTRDVYLNYGPDGEFFVRGGAVARDGSGGGPEVELVQYADEAAPTPHRSATNTPETLAVTVQLIAATGVDNYAAWKRALTWRDENGNSYAVTYREPGGLVKRGTAILGSWDPGDRWKSAISFTITDSTE